MHCRILAQTSWSLTWVSLNSIWGYCRSPLLPESPVSHQNGLMPILAAFYTYNGANLVYQMFRIGFGYPKVSNTHFLYTIRGKGETSSSITVYTKYKCPSLFVLRNKKNLVHTLRRRLRCEHKIKAAAAASASSRADILPKSPETGVDGFSKSIRVANMLPNN